MIDQRGRSTVSSQPEDRQAIYQKYLHLMHGDATRFQRWVLFTFYNIIIIIIILFMLLFAAVAEDAALSRAVLIWSDDDLIRARGQFRSIVLRSSA